MPDPLDQTGDGADDVPDERRGAPWKQIWGGLRLIFWDMWVQPWRTFRASRRDQGRPPSPPGATGSGT